MKFWQVTFLVHHRNDDRDRTACWTNVGRRSSFGQLDGALGKRRIDFDDGGDGRRARKTHLSFCRAEKAAGRELTISRDPKLRNFASDCGARSPSLTLKSGAGALIDVRANHGHQDVDRVAVDRHVGFHIAVEPDMN